MAVMRREIFVVFPVIYRFLIIVGASSEANVEFQCSDPKCTDVISQGTTLLKYPRGADSHMSFDTNKEVRIYGKSESILDVEIDGKRGYVPIKFVREDRKLKKDLVTVLKNTKAGHGDKQPVDRPTDQGPTVDDPGGASRVEVSSSVANPEPLESSTRDTPALGTTSSLSESNPSATAPATQREIDSSKAVPPTGPTESPPTPPTPAEQDSRIISEKPNLTVVDGTTMLLEDFDGAEEDTFSTSATPTTTLESASSSITTSPLPNHSSTVSEEASSAGEIPSSLHPENGGGFIYSAGKNILGYFTSVGNKQKVDEFETDINEKDIDSETKDQVKREVVEDGENSTIETPMPETVPISEDKSAASEEKTEANESTNKMTGAAGEVKTMEGNGILPNETKEANTETPTELGAADKKDSFKEEIKSSEDEIANKEAKTESPTAKGAGVKEMTSEVEIKEGEIPPSEEMEAKAKVPTESVGNSTNSSSKEEIKTSESNGIEGLNKTIEGDDIDSKGIKTSLKDAKENLGDKEEAVETEEKVSDIPKPIAIDKGEKENLLAESSTNEAKDAENTRDNATNSKQIPVHNANGTLGKDSDQKKNNSVADVKDGNVHHTRTLKQLQGMKTDSPEFSKQDKIDKTETTNEKGDTSESENVSKESSEGKSLEAVNSTQTESGKPDDSLSGTQTLIPDDNLPKTGEGIDEKVVEKDASKVDSGTQITEDEPSIVGVDKAEERGDSEDEQVKDFPENKGQDDAEVERHGQEMNGDSKMEPVQTIDEEKSVNENVDQRQTQSAPNNHDPYRYKTMEEKNIDLPQKVTEDTQEKEAENHDTSQHKSMPEQPENATSDKQEQLNQHQKPSPQENLDSSQHQSAPDNTEQSLNGTADTPENEKQQNSAKPNDRDTSQQHSTLDEIEESQIVSQNSQQSSNNEQIVEESTQLDQTQPNPALEEYLQVETGDESADSNQTREQSEDLLSGASVQFHDSYQTEGEGTVGKERTSSDDEPVANVTPFSEDYSDIASLPPADDSVDYIELLRSCTQVVIDLLPSPLYESLLEMKKTGLPLHASVLTFLTGLLSVILLSLNVFIQRRSKENYLNEKLCASEQQLFKMGTERDILRDELATVKQQSMALYKSVQEHQNQAKTLHRELEALKNQNNELYALAESLQGQLGVQQGAFHQLEEEKANWTQESHLLQERAERAEERISTLARDLQQKNQEIQQFLHGQTESKAFERDMQDKVQQLEHGRDQLLLEAQDWNARVLELQDQLEGHRQNELQANRSLAEKTEQLEVLEEALDSLKFLEGGSDELDQDLVKEKLAEVVDVTKVKLELRSVREQLEATEKRLADEKRAYSHLQERCDQAESRIASMKEGYELALQERSEATTKLEVLSSYFQEKETHLQKELGVQVAIRQQHEGTVSTAEQRVADIIRENSTCKAQLVSLKQELVETERGFKAQVLAQEKKAHENWLAARAAERKLEEAKQEGAVLRQRLTLMERERELASKAALPKNETINGEATSSDVDDPDSSGSIKNSAPPTDRLPPFPVAFPLPMDRPRPPPAGFLPMFPPPPPPHFLPPFDSWRFPHHPLDRRPSPLDFERRSTNTPMQGRPSPPPLPGRMSPPPPPGSRGRFSPTFNRGGSRFSPPGRGGRMSPPPFVRGRTSSPPRRPSSRGRMSPPFSRGSSRMSPPPPTGGGGSRGSNRLSSPPRHHYERRQERFSPPGGRDSDTPPHLPRFHDVPPPPMWGKTFVPPQGYVPITPPPPNNRREPPPHPADLRKEGPHGGSSKPTRPISPQKNNGPTTSV